MDNAGTYTISKYLDYNYLYYPASINGSGKDFGNAILSRWPIEKYKKVILPHESPWNKRRRIAVTGIINMGDTKILATSVHIETPVLETEYRIDQADSLLRSIPEDFKHKFDWVTSNIGWTKDFLSIKKVSLDHIFVKGMRQVESGKFTGTEASDHLPVWATLVIE